MGKLIRKDIAKLIYEKIHAVHNANQDSHHSNESDEEDEFKNNVLLTDEKDALQHLSEQDCNVFVRLCTQVLSESLMTGHSIELRDFGIFELRVRKAKQKARNPRTGEVVNVPQHAVVAFRSGKRMRNAVWHLDDE